MSYRQIANCLSILRRSLVKKLRNARSPVAVCKHSEIGHSRATAANTGKQLLCAIRTDVPFSAPGGRVSLENRGGELKEYLIGVQVFDRKSSFDARLDPIVRVEARRLRTKLQQFYEREGREDEIRIDLPKGNYAAQFSKRVASAPLPATPASQPPEPAIAIIPFA